MDWKLRSRVARWWAPRGNDGQVECSLCPRHCKPRVSHPGFCGVRTNIDGKLHTLNYGKSVQASVEFIETEAVYHYNPGARILCLGNIGCNMSCSYCQNWETSQFRHVEPEFVFSYEPEQIVEIAARNDIGVLSWTYNDPVVWHEFVMDTARIAAKQGIKNLFKSAFYIEEEPARELCEVIDIFSVSLKSLDPDFYTKHARGRMEPVLKAIKIAHASGRHLEISNLIVTGLNDKEEDIRAVARWIVNELGPEIPLHFVRFHPAYKYTDQPRTPLETMNLAYRVAREEGVRFPYLGNLYEQGVSDTHCTSCAALLVQRFGVSTEIVGLDDEGRCLACLAPGSITHPRGLSTSKPMSLPAMFAQGHKRFDWTSEVNSLHIQCEGDDAESILCQVSREPSGKTHSVQLGAGLSRTLVARASPEETAVEIRWDANRGLKFLPLLDRAHFPVTSSLLA